MKHTCIYNFKLKNVSENTLDLYIDGELVDAETEDLYKEWFNDTTSISYRTIRNTILEAKPKVLNIYVNSPGGNIVEAMATHDFVQELKKEGVVVNGYGIGIIASASTYILSGCTNSYITPNSTYMIHNLSGGVSGSIKDIESYFNMMVTYDNLVKDFYVNTTGKSKEQITQWMDAETFFTGKQAVDNGFVKYLSEEKTFTNVWKPEYFQFKNQEVFKVYNSFVNNNIENRFSMKTIQEAFENVLKNFGFVKKEGEEPKNITPITEDNLRNALREELKDVVVEPTEDQLKKAIQNFFKEGLPENITKQLGDAVTNATKEIPTNEKIKELEDELEAIKNDIANNKGGAKPRNTGGNGGTKYEHEGISFEEN